MKSFPGALSQLAIPIALFVLVSSARAAEPPAAAEPAPPLLAVSLPVTLSVSPAPSPFPFWSSPKVGDGTQITLTATAFPSPLQYSFTAMLLPSGQTFVLQNVANQAKWAPPKGGDYNFKVVVRRGLTVEGSASVNNFHVKPSFASTAKISANPPVMGLPGAFTISAMVLPPPSLLGAGAMMNKFWFSSVQQFVPQSPQVWQGPISARGNTAVWKPNPQLASGLYAIPVYVQTFNYNVLIAEGLFGTASTTPADFYRGYYAVLLPPGPCPIPTPTADPTQPFGWLIPITTQNSSSQPVATRQGSANCAIAGYSINDIVNNPQLRVRTINVSCSNCHIGIGRAWFCSVLPLGFPHTQPPDNEATLYNLFANWKIRGCPD